MKPIYLDHNATTEIEEGAKSALLFFSSTSHDPNQNFGNVSSIHWAGRKLKAPWELAHEQVAALIGAERGEDICFTSCATESINAAIKGAFFHHLESGASAESFHCILSNVEHEASYESARFIEKLGARLHLVPVDSAGALNLECLAEILRETKGQRFLSMMAANNETGVIFPLVQISKMAQEAGALFHIDAVQAPGKMPFSLKDSPADLVSLSGHKIGGPKGVGALYLKRGTTLAHLLHGGKQERNRRAGTINVAGTISFGVAAQNLKSVSPELRDYCEARVKEKLSGVEVLGFGQPRLSNTSNFIFDGVRGESLTMGLDLAGFAVSSGSACNSGSIQPSRVLMSMGLDKVTAASALRVSLGLSNTREDIDAFVAALVPLVMRIREQAKKRGALDAALK